MQLVAFAAAAAVVAGGQFNLNCNGTLHTIVPYLLKDTTEPYATAYRIDLGARKWCSGECKAQLDIISVTPVAIVLEDKDIDTPREHEKRHSQISRETGRQLMSVQSGVGQEHFSMFWDGQCEKAPFTGFPTVETKF